MVDYILSIMAYVLPFYAGWLFTNWLLGEKGRAYSALSRAVLSWGVGCQLVTFPLMCLVLAGFQLSAAHVWIAATLIVCIFFSRIWGLRRGDGRNAITERPRAALPRPTPATACIVLLLGVIAAYVLSVWLFDAQWAWDVFRIHGDRSKFLYHTGRLRELVEPDRDTLHATYPYFYPFFQVWIYHLLGGVVFWASYPMTIVFTLGTSVVIYEICRHLGCSRTVSLLSIVLYLISAKEVTAFTVITYLDPIVAFYGAAAVLAVLKACRGQFTAWGPWLLVGLLLGCQSQVKEEGAVFAVLLLIGTLYLVLWLKKDDHYSPARKAGIGALVTVTFLLILLPWNLYARSAIKSAEHYGEGLALSSERVFRILSLCAEQLFTPSAEKAVLYPTSAWFTWDAPWSGGLFVALLLLSLLIAPRLQFKKELTLLWIPVAGLFLALVGAYITTSEELTGHVRTSFLRVYSDVYPLAATIVALTVSEVVRGFSHLKPGMRYGLHAAVIVALGVPLAAGTYTSVQSLQQGQFVDAVGPLAPTSTPVLFESGLHFLGYRIEQDGASVESGPDVIDLSKASRLTMYWKAENEIERVWDNPDQTFLFSYCQFSPRGSNRNWYSRPPWHPPSTWPVGKIYKLTLTLTPRDYKPDFRNWAVQVSGDKVKEARGVHNRGYGICGDVQFVQPE